MCFILLLSQDTLIVSNAVSNKIDYWFWISLFELAIILILTKKLFRSKKALLFDDLSKDNKDKFKKTEIDMNNVVNSINKSRDLYKILSSTCHPDRFVNTTKQTTAESIFKEITENKRNYEQLLLIKDRAVSELNIKI